MANLPPTDEQKVELKRMNFWISAWDDRHILLKKEDGCENDSFGLHTIECLEKLFNVDYVSWGGDGCHLFRWRNP